ncbi:hypothetical protein DL96DRAFT_1629803 [Flagelloscypha sp. PMI_526]|nr:hypothetical protein DL96DRAFT_1629803 [Flagelloscypha sp. PMI_526]
MILATTVVLCAAFIGMASASPASPRAGTCSPPAFTGVSIGNPHSTILGVPIELGFRGGTLLQWVKAPAGTHWTIIKSGSNFKLKTELGHQLTPVITGEGSFLKLGGGIGNAELIITCNTCPENGLATDCSIKPAIQPDLCVFSDIPPDVGQSTGVFIFECDDFGEGNFTFDYHL